MTSSLPLLLHGLVILDGLLCASQADQHGAQARMAGAGVGLGIRAFFFAPGQFLAQLLECVVHGCECVCSAPNSARRQSLTVLGRSSCCSVC